MWPKFKTKRWPSSLFKLILMVAAVGVSGKRTDEPDADPMEPCYLANNRASESLTISESTPVGTVVGEILVNGDSSTNGNIELSIKMPAGQLVRAQDSGRLPPSQRQYQTNGYESSASASNGRQHTGAQLDPSSPTTFQAKSARDLSDLIDLMPPLSIEHQTKRLILAKKLDRENLDKYIQANGYQSSGVSSQLTHSSSSASLTVHIKCQLRNQLTASHTPNMTQNIPSASLSSSIVIPIHLIVTDENDNWPTFVNSPYIIDLNETVQVGSLLPGNEILAVDNDQQGPLSTIEYSVVPGTFWSDSFTFLNPLDSRSLVVKDNHLLDYESQSKLTLKVMARDQGDPPNWAITSLYINLADNDDLNPVFSEDKYVGFVKENRPGEIIDMMPKRLLARDGDKALGASIVYSFHQKTNHSIYFDLDADLGRLTLKKSLPHDQDNKLKYPICLLIRATQVDNSHRRTVTMINIRRSAQPFGSDSASKKLEHLLNLGSQAQDQQVSISDTTGLKFMYPNFTLEISESAPEGSTVINLGSKINKSPTKDRYHDHINFQILDNELGYFNLDERTGRLTLNRSLEYELYRQLSVRVLVTQEYYSESKSDTSQTVTNSNSYPNILCDITRVNVQILNHNDYTPEFSHEQYNFQLSISDLIANYDLSKVHTEVGPESEKNKINDLGAASLIKRSGEFDGDESLDDHLGWKAMQLGQVYCSDRDHGDKVSLQLLGSKASLFQLTNEGRLYLPLMNLTNQLDDARSSRRHDLAASSWTPSNVINNQFVPSRLFFSRRSDVMDHEAPDRNYLNFLLSELSNLGRLRLKVLASDDGQPQKKQATAIIVITIISIDNFILQRAPHLPNGIKSDLNRTATEVGKSDDQQERHGRYTNQVMMIPATNGRSFVQINPDIISNLITQNVHPQPDSANMSRSEQSQRRNADSVSTNSSLRTSDNDLQSAGSTQELRDGQAALKNQPPGLLLVDDDGAKFVAMQAAIEVYNQQMQEALDLQQQQARQREQSGQMDMTKRSSRADNSFWYQWRNQFSGDQTPGSLHWVNLSMALVLHLIVLAVIIGLFSKVRSALNNTSFVSHFRQLGLSDGFNYLRGKMSDSEQSVMSIHNQTSGTYGHRVTIDHGPESNYAYLKSSSVTNRWHTTGIGRQAAGSILDSPEFANNSARQQIVDRGVVVSAVSSIYKPIDGTKPTESKVIEPAPKEHGLSLLDQAKSKRNKFDTNNLKMTQSTSKVSASSFDGAGLGRYKKSPAIGSKPGLEKFVEVKPAVSCDKKLLGCNKSSTFLGNQSAQSVLNGVETNTTIVSIKVPAIQRANLKLESDKDKLNQSSKFAIGSSSSNSSVVSLVSTSSSISNKINAAIEHTCDNATGSEISSLNSNNLFPSSLTDTGPQNVSEKKEKPLPPPPPPPSVIKASFSQPEKHPLASLQEVVASYQSAPFSSLPSDKIDKSLPQNPQHMRLKQQASQHAKEPNYVKCPSIGSLNGKSSSKQPPTPPPLPPPSGMLSSAKAVSPTTSVDRGYESLQSYTSSSQHRKQSLQQQRQSTPNVLRPIDLNKNRSSVNSAPTGCGSSSSLAPSIFKVAGRQAQRVLSKRTQDINHAGRQPSKPSTSTDSHYYQKRLLDEQLVEECQQSRRVTGRSMAQKVSSSMSKQRPTANTCVIQSQPLKRQNSRLNRRFVGSVLDYETEDDDFIFYDKQQGQETSAVISSQLGVNKLNDYVSHAYKQEHPNNMMVGTQELVLQQKQQQQQQQQHLDHYQAIRRIPSCVSKSTATESDLMISQAMYQIGAELHSSHHPHSQDHNHDRNNNHYHPLRNHHNNNTGGKTSKQPKHQTQHPSVAHGGTVGKKQLTWSDQVGVG